MPARLRAHWLFFALVAVGAALRTIVFLAYRPALFSPDSAQYLTDSAHLRPPALWPIGYPAFLGLFPSGHLALVPLAQHLLGLALAVLLYVVLLRLDIRRWAAALAAAPVLLDAYQLDIEQYVLSETVFELALVGAAAALLWRRALTTPWAVVAGVLLAGAALTRGIAVLAIGPAVVAAFCLNGGRTPRARLVPATALAVAFVALVGGYAVWYHDAYGSYALAGSAGRRLYGRVAPWVDCRKITVPPYERVLCPSAPVGRRPLVYYLVWAKSSPINRIRLPPGKNRNQVAADFGRRAIAGQPLTYARVVGSDFLATFAPMKRPRPGGYRVAQWQFQTRFPIPGYPRAWSPRPPPGYRGGANDAHVSPRLAAFLRGYQRFGYTPGPLLALGLVVGLLAAAGLGRARGSGVRTSAFLFPGLALVLCLGSLLIVPFSWRYQLPQLVLLPPAAVVGLTALLRGDPRRAHAGRRQTRKPVIEAVSGRP